MARGVVCSPNTVDFWNQKRYEKFLIQDSRWQEMGKKSGALACPKEPFHEKALLQAVGRWR
jgi:hypothetical protein